MMTISAGGGQAARQTTDSVIPQPVGAGPPGMCVGVHGGLERCRRRILQQHHGKIRRGKGVVSREWEELEAQCTNEKCYTWRMGILWFKESYCVMEFRNIPGSNNGITTNLMRGNKV